LGNKILVSFFQSVTTRTAGFNTIPLDQLSDAAKFVFIILMFIGASPASTGGGIKTVTAVVVLLMVMTAAQGKREVNVFGRRISQNTTMRALSVVSISLGMLVFFTILLLIFEPLHFIDLFFETASALGTVGLATFDTAMLSMPSKIVIIISMFIGRVGPLTLVLALARKQNIKKPPVRYPEGKVMVG
jgi:trk system potassium uptake protein TrkH